MKKSYKESVEALNKISEDLDKDDIFFAILSENKSDEMQTVLNGKGKKITEIILQAMMNDDDVAYFITSAATIFAVAQMEDLEEEIKNKKKKKLK